MKVIRIAAAATLLMAAASFQTIAQNAVQTLNVTLTAYNQNTASTIKQFRVTSKDLIRFFTGSNVAGAQLLLVTPVASQVLFSTGNMNSFLRIAKGNNTIMEVQTPNSFNLFQDAVSTQSRLHLTNSIATDRFSIDFGEFHAELQGFNTWTSGSALPVMAGPVRTLPLPSPVATVPGIGSFATTVSGEGTIDEVTFSGVPMQGTVTGGTPKLEQQ